MYLLRLLGGHSLEGSEGPVSGRAAQRRQSALLALLGAAGEKGVSRDKLVGYLWPESDDQRARHLLRDSLYILRKELGDHGVLTTGSAVRLNPEVVSCDVNRFETALENGSLEEAVGHYGGAFLDGFHARESHEYEHWMETERRRLAARYEDALQSLANAAEEASDHPRAASWWRRLAAHDPFNTRYVLSLMGALAAAGDPANALHCAEEHERVLRLEIGEDAASEFKELAEKFKQKGVSAWAELAAPESSDGYRALAVEEVLAAEVDARPPGTVSSRHRWRLSPIKVLAVGLIVVAGWLVMARAGRWLGLGSAEPSTISVAILPFVNMTDDPENGYFSDGVTLEIINALASHSDLRVIPQASAFTYKGQPFDPRKVARELSVDAVLTGTLLQRDTELSLGVELVDVPGNDRLWGARYDRSVEDIFDIREEIVLSVAAALGQPLSAIDTERLSRGSTRDLEAYELYLKGVYLSAWSLFSDFPKAIEYLEESISRDSTFASAYSALAYVNAWSAYVTSPREAYARAKAAAEAALKIDDQLADAHAVLGMIEMYLEWDWTAAEREFRRAIDLNPNSTLANGAYSDYLGRMGRFDEAIAFAERRRQLDPLAPDAEFWLGFVHRMAGRYDEAADYFQRQLELHPGSGLAAAQLALVYSANGLTAEAAAQAERAHFLLRADLDLLPAVAIVYAISGKRAAARKILEDVRRERTRRYFDATHIAAMYDALGDVDEAIYWYGKGFEERSPDIVWGVRTHPEPWQNARSDARYRQLIGRLGIP